MSSFILWLDHTVLDKGEAYTNLSSKLYKVTNAFYGLETFGLPFKQIVADRSIAGANIMSGVLLNGVFCSTGQSGLANINYNEGQVYFNTPITSTVSGNCAVKDFNIYLTSEPDEKILFETKYEIRPRTSRELTGLAPDTLTYPAIFVKNDGGFNEPFAFGGVDKTILGVKCIILSDSQFHMDALTSILRDTARSFVPLIQVNEMPFDSWGGLRGGSYNYNSLVANKLDSTQNLWISKVHISNFSESSIILSELRKLNSSSKIYTALVDFETEIIRVPH